MYYFNYPKNWIIISTTSGFMVDMIIEQQITVILWIEAEGVKLTLFEYSK